MGYLEMRCPICGTVRHLDGSWVHCSECDTIWPLDELEEKRDD